MSRVVKDLENNVFGKITDDKSFVVSSFTGNFSKEVMSLEKFFYRLPETTSEEFGFEIFSVDGNVEATYAIFFEMLRLASGNDYSFQLEKGIFTAYLDNTLIHLETVGEFDESSFDKIGFKAASLDDKKYEISADREILIATHNEGKTKEFRQMFAELGYTVKNLNDFPDLPEVAETGSSFEENARLKAETISELTGKMVLADDSGLMVDILGGLPGIWSARFAGDNATDAANNAKLLHELASTAVTPERRKANFHTALVVAAPDKESLVVEADWDGYIATIPKGDNGFGYDPLFEVGETGKTAAQLPMEEKNKISHRARALAKLLDEWEEWAK